MGLTGIARTLVLLAAAGSAALAQSSGTTSLAIQVRPEAYVQPRQVSLRFVVSPDGTADVLEQPALIEAWVRALPGQKIRVNAQALGDLTGPGGTIPMAAVSWNGSRTGGTHGGLAAECTSGTFGGASAQLSTGWLRSGTLNCALRFVLMGPRRFAAGVYTGAIAIDVVTE